jgi:hypothetical protein
MLRLAYISGMEKISAFDLVSAVFLANLATFAVLAAVWHIWRHETRGDPFRPWPVIGAAAFVILNALALWVKA